MPDKLKELLEGRVVKVRGDVVDGMPRCQELLREAANLNIQLPQVRHVLEGLSRLPEGLAFHASWWFFESFPDAKHVLAGGFRASVRLLQREDNSWGSFEGWSWYVEVDIDEKTRAEKDSFWRTLIKDRKPSSKVVKPSELAKKHFDRSLGVLNPKQIVDLVESVDDVNAPFFWELLRLGHYRGQEQQQRLLYGKMAVRTKRFGSEVRIILEEDCMLADPVPVKDALEAIGCYIAVDVVPSSIADNKPAHVARHVQWLKSKGMLAVDTANGKQRSALCEHFLKESLDVEVLKVFAELPICSMGDSYVPLKCFCGSHYPRALRFGLQV